MLDDQRPNQETENQEGYVQGVLVETTGLTFIFEFYEGQTKLGYRRHVSLVRFLI